MTIETELAQVAAKSADVAFNLAAELVNEKPGKLLKLLYAFGPKKAVHWVANGRLRLTQVKMQEELFNQCCQAVLEQAEGDIRLLATVMRSFAYIPDEAASFHEQDRADESDLSWWSMFEDFARRPNEEWRLPLA